jgi:hypothetical protein
LRGDPMGWIVRGEENGRIQLVSDRKTTGILPKGSFLTVERGNARFVLRVDESSQSEQFSPSPMIIDLDLSPLVEDQECRNLLSAYRVRDLTIRKDGFIDFILPQSTARRATQEEVNAAIESQGAGPKVFIATIHASQDQVLRDEAGKPITATLPQEMFWHQILICGRTGSGKTVAAKYLAQHFVEDLDGAVLAVNVKDVDFLRMDRPSRPNVEGVSEEWAALGETARGVRNFTIYHPAPSPIDPGQAIDPRLCHAVTLDVKRIEPESLAGLLTNVSDIAAQNLPNIFRYWQQKEGEKGSDKQFTFAAFARYFSERDGEGRHYPTMNTRGELSEVTLHPATSANLARNLDVATDFFDNQDAERIDESNILVRGKLSVINVTGDRGIKFGSILLRDLLHRIVAAKDAQRSDVPILIIIDEVHEFYNTESSLEALGDLDTICRTGRSKRIGVLFSSQTPSDVPRGLSSVINTRIFFKTDASAARDLGVRVTPEEMEAMRKGFAVVSIHNMAMLKVVKFPVAFGGVID